MYKIAANFSDIDKDMMRDCHGPIWHHHQMKCDLSEIGQKDKLWSQLVTKDEALCTQNKYSSKLWFQFPQFQKLRVFTTSDLLNHNSEISSDKVTSSVSSNDAQFKIPYPPSHISSYHVKKNLSQVKHLYKTIISDISEIRKCEEENTVFINSDKSKSDIEIKPEIPELQTGLLDNYQEALENLNNLGKSTLIF